MSLDDFSAKALKRSLRSRSYQGRITKQMERLGGSFDWDRVAFTLSDVSFSISVIA